MTIRDVRVRVSWRELMVGVAVSPRGWRSDATGAWLLGVDPAAVPALAGPWRRAWRVTLCALPGVGVEATVCGRMG